MLEGFGDDAGRRLVAAPAAQAPIEKGRLGIALTEITKPWTGDLNGMVGRRMIAC